MAKSVRSKQRRKNRVTRCVRYGRKERIKLRKTLSGDTVVPVDAVEGELGVSFLFKCK